MAAATERLLYIGLMSGTSLDGMDVVLVDFSGARPQVLAAATQPFSDTLRQDLLILTQPGDNEIEKLGVADRQLAIAFASAVKQLLEKSGFTAADITAIGSHGQTIRHRPQSSERSPQDAFTLQIGDPNTVAFETGITTVADFRRMDVAAGGQGAPLAPALHADLFADPVNTRAVVNIGGISNITLLAPNALARGFDTGPGNVLMDYWIQKNRGEHFDRNGDWAASGRVDTSLLSRLAALPFFAGLGTVSTGREDFSPELLESLLTSAPTLAAEDIQATLLHFTASCISEGLNKSHAEAKEIYICGGGAHNTALMQALADQLPDSRISSTEVLGIPPDWVEGVAFAWLAKRRIESLSGNLPSVTGASQSISLGGIWTPR